MNWRLLLFVLDKFNQHFHDPTCMEKNLFTALLPHLGATKKSRNADRVLPNMPPSNGIALSKRKL